MMKKKKVFFELKNVASRKFEATSNKWCYYEISFIDGSSLVVRHIGGYICYRTDENDLWNNVPEDMEDRWQVFFDLMFRNKKHLVKKLLVSETDDGGMLRMAL